VAKPETSNSFSALAKRTSLLRASLMERRRVGKREFDRKNDLAQALFYQNAM
jgi:hypothetical protein